MLWLAGSLETASRDVGYQGDTESCACGSTSQDDGEQDFPPSYAEAVQVSGISALTEVR